MGEKVEATKIWFFGIALLIAAILIFTGLRWLMMPVEKIVERKVLVESHQYKQGMNERVAMFESALIEVDAKLSTGIDAQTRSNLEAQRSALNAQLNAARKVQ